MIRYLSLPILLILFSLEASGQDLTTTSFRVSGNCDMCKAKIERAAGKKKTGVRSAKWDKTSKTMVVKYDPAIVSPEEIHSRIAGAGYDTDKVRAEDAVYRSLHHCCQYERESHRHEAEE